MVILTHISQQLLESLDKKTNYGKFESTQQLMITHSFQTHTQKLITLRKPQKRINIIQTIVCDCNAFGLGINSQKDDKKKTGRLVIERLVDNEQIPRTTLLTKAGSRYNKKPIQ